MVTRNIDFGYESGYDSNKKLETFDEYDSDATEEMITYETSADEEVHETIIEKKCDVIPHILFQLAIGFCALKFITLCKLLVYT